MSIDEARELLGRDVLGPGEVEQAFGALRAEDAARPIPFKLDDLTRAADTGEMLVLRTTQTTAPLTISAMVGCFPEAFDQKLLRHMGYQLKDDWGIEIEPLATRDTCEAGWALVRKTVLPQTCNLSYGEQDRVLQRAGASRRRTAVEAVYDTLLYFATRQVRLLDKTWDWSASRTIDGGYLNVGGFGASGLQILSFSTAVRHGGLGICPTRQPRQ